MRYEYTASVQSLLQSPMRLLRRADSGLGTGLTTEPCLERDLSRTTTLGPTNGFSLTEELNDSDEVPPYAVLSHTWGKKKDEVTFRDMLEGSGMDKLGYEKIRFCANQAERDGLHYFWVDTCCIDKSNSTELSEAINSMFRWYQKSTRCYVYLSDLSVESYDQSRPIESRPEVREAFRDCKWFTRGWTLQELIAPPSVEFFSKEGTKIGDRTSLQQEIHQITGIPVRALRGCDTKLSTFSVQERMTWTKNRETKREEDAAYCLLGLFDVHMPPIYGESKGNAFARLREEIDKRPRNEPDGSASLESSGWLQLSALPWEMFRWIKQFTTKDESTHIPSAEESTHMPSAKDAFEKQPSSCQPVNIRQAGSEFRNKITISGGTIYEGNSITL
jgi:hypothetical protein